MVKQLKVTLLGEAPTARMTDPQAYALYLQAVQLGRQFTAAAFQESDALYRKVLAIDPRYAPAWAALAENLRREAGLGLLSNKEGFAQAREAATKALAIDPDYAPAHARLGRIAMSGDNDLAGAAEHFKHALALDPSDLDVLRNSAVFLVSLGRLDEALALVEAVVRRDPVNVSAISNLGLYQRMAGRLDAAIATFRTVLSLSPGRGNAHAQLGNALLLKGDVQGALAEIEQETSEVWKMVGLPMADHTLGRKVDSDAALAKEIEQDQKDGPYNIAYVYGYRGEPDEAFEWLDHGGRVRRRRSGRDRGRRTCSTMSAKTRAGCRSCASSARRRSNSRRSSSPCWRCRRRARQHGERRSESPSRCGSRAAKKIGCSTPDARGRLLRVVSTRSVVAKLS